MNQTVRRPKAASNYSTTFCFQLTALIDICLKTKDKDYENILNRRKKIESYKEQSESLRQELARKIQLEASKREEQRRAEEMRRLDLESKENEKKRRLAEQVSSYFFSIFIKLNFFTGRNKEED